MSAISACPVCIVEGKYQPVTRHRWACERPLESYTLLDDVLADLSAIDRYGIDPATPVVVVDKTPDTGSFRGGTVRYWIGLLKIETGRTFGEYVDWIAVSDCNGVLETAIPA